MEASRFIHRREDRPPTGGAAGDAPPRCREGCRGSLESPGSRLGAAPGRGGRPGLGGSGRRGREPVAQEDRGVASPDVATHSAHVDTSLHVQRLLHLTTSPHVATPSLHVARTSLHVATPSAHVEPSPYVERSLHLVTPYPHVAIPVSTCGDLPTCGDLYRCSDPLSTCSDPLSTCREDRFGRTILCWAAGAVCNGADGSSGDGAWKMARKIKTTQNQPRRGGGI